MSIGAEVRGEQSTPLVAGYRLERIASEEPGFHVLYDAVDPVDGRPVSVKVFAAEPDRRMARQFMRQTKRRASLEHPHLLQIYAASHWEGRLVMVTERCDLLTVADGLKGGPLTPGETIEILSEVAEALDAASAAGVVDHELAPATIMLDPDRGALLGDLGVVVSLTPGLAPWGYPHPGHIAPEVTRGERLVAGSNVYSLASVMIECLTGRQPYNRSLQLVAYSHAAGPSPSVSMIDPNLGEEIDAVLAVALAKSPEDRFPDARSLMKAAAGALGVGPSTVARLPTPADARPEAVPPAPPARRDRPDLRRLGVAAVAALVAAALAVGGYLVGGSGTEPRAVAPARPAAGPSPAAIEAAGEVNGVVERLNRSVRSGRTRLASARTPAGQARAAGALAGAYRMADASIKPIAASRDFDPGALQRPLADAARAYARLGRAARAQNRRAFAAARRDVRGAEAALRTELAALR